MSFSLTATEVLALETAEASWLQQAEEQLAPEELITAKAEWDNWTTHNTPETRLAAYSHLFVDSGTDIPAVLVNAIGWQPTDNDPVMTPLFDAYYAANDETGGENNNGNTGGNNSGSTAKAGFGSVGILLLLGAAVALMAKRR